MLCRPERSKRFIIVMNRPGLISATHGSPRAFSFRSRLNAPVASGSTARMARVHTSTIRGSSTVFASAAMPDTPLARSEAPKYDRRSTVLMRTSRPCFHRHWQAKSRPGRYSDSVNKVGATPRISSHCRIQPRACSSDLTGVAPEDAEPLRMRHHTGETPPNRRHVASNPSRPGTAYVAGTAIPFVAKSS